MKNKIEVTISYTWTIANKEWREGEEFIDNLYDIEQKANFDCIDVFHHLNQITRPGYSVEVRAKEVE